MAGPVAFPPEEKGRLWLHGAGGGREGGADTRVASQDRPLIHMHIIPFHQKASPGRGGGLVAGSIA